MRYIRKKTTITTVADFELTDEEEILSLLKKLSKSSVDISIQYIDPSNQFVKSNHKARITSVSDSAVSLTLFYQKGSFRVDSLPIGNIQKLEINTEHTNLVVAPKNISRYDFMDIIEEGK